MTQQSQTIKSTRRRMRPETNAWLVLIAAFMIFCALVAGLGVGGWYYYSSAMVPMGGLVRVHAKAGVTHQAKSSAKLDTPREPCADNPPGVDDACATLNEGDRVRAVPQAGYGPVASLTLPDQTQIDMWAHPTGADLTLNRYQVSRWTKQRQVVSFKQAAGYARYDIPPKANLPYADVSYSVIVGQDVTIALAPGGSYSINVPYIGPDRPRALTESGAPMLAEVAVRSGSAEVQAVGKLVAITTGEKIQVDIAGTPSEPLPARWELIRDGNFEQYATKVSPDGVPAWTEYTDLFDQSVTPEEQNATFVVKQRCRPETPDNCGEATDQTYIGQFRREGNQQKSFGYGISQTLDVDVSEYRSLRFSIWVRVVQQTVPQAGIQNSECPITVQFIFKQRSPTDQEQRRYLCVYQGDTNNIIQNGESEFKYRPVQQYLWYRLRFELRDADLLESARYLQKLNIYANGHDYISEVTDVSLIGTQ